MRQIDELVVSEYFEQNGFLVQPLRSARLQSKRPDPVEGIDLYVRNTQKTTGQKPGFILFSNELRHIPSAIVSVNAWHSDKAALATMSGGAEMLRYLETSVLKKLDTWLDFDDAKSLGEKECPMKIVVAPMFPTQEPYRSQIVGALSDRGVGGVLSFKSILLDLIDRVDTKRVYLKSDVMQLLRALKTFELLKTSQMNFL